MIRENEKTRLWLFVALLVLGGAFVVMICISPGGIEWRALITIVPIIIAAAAGVAVEIKKIRRTEYKVQAIPLRMELGGNVQSTKIKDMINVSFCAVFVFADGTTHKVYFHSSKVKKMLMQCGNRSVELYYKELNGSYWLTKVEPFGGKGI